MRVWTCALLGVLGLGYGTLGYSETLVREDVLAAIDSYMEMYSEAVEFDDALSKDQAISCKLKSQNQLKEGADAEGAKKTPEQIEEDRFQALRDATRKQKQQMDNLFRQTQLAQDSEALSGYIVALNAEDFNETVAHLLSLYTLKVQEGYYKPKAIAALLQQISLDLRKAKVVDERNRSTVTRVYDGALFAMTVLAAFGSLSKFNESQLMRTFKSIRRSEGVLQATGQTLRFEIFKDALYQFRAGVGAFRLSGLAGKSIRHSISFPWLGTTFMDTKFVGAAKALGSTMVKLVQGLGSGAKTLVTKRFWTHTFWMRDASKEMKIYMKRTAAITAGYVLVPEDWNYIQDWVHGESQREKLDPLNTLSLLNAKGTFDLGEEVVEELLTPAFAEIPEVGPGGDYSPEALKAFEEKGLDIQMKMFDYCGALEAYSMANNEQKLLSPEYLNSVSLPEFHRQYQSTFGYSEKPEYQKLITDTQASPEVSLAAIDSVLSMLKMRLERADEKIVELAKAREAAALKAAQKTEKK